MPLIAYHSRDSRWASSGISNRCTSQHGWLLAIAANILLILGTSSRCHLAENLAAGSLSLHGDEVAILSTAFS